jgi:adenosylhomocysteine nucleosidase
VKILVVDDDQAKSDAIGVALEQSVHGRGPNSITVVTTLADAIRVMSLLPFDMIVLDLMLPYISGGSPDSRAGLELLRQLRSKKGPNRATTVIGLSAFPEEIAATRENFDELGVLIIKFDDDGSWNGALLRILEDIQTRLGIEAALDFVVVCALEEERNGFAQTEMIKLSEAIVGGLNVHYVKLPGNPELFGAVVRLSQMGLVAATLETALVLRAFRTKVLCMSGICAGFSREASLGQLVVASPAWEYQAGKWSKNGFEIAPVQIPLGPGTRAIIDQTVGHENFMAYVESRIGQSQNRPARQHKPILAPFATGSAVIADASRLTHIEMQHRKVAALDMETFGLYYVAHQAGSALEHFFAVKCVVDLADTQKDDDLHSFGCIVAARATERLVHSLLMSS